MDAVEMDAAGNQGSPRRAGYRRSSGSRRGETRRQDLLDRVTNDLAVNGLVDFSLRRAAGTTHKVLLYHFEGADDLLTQAVLRLRDRRSSRPGPGDVGGSGARRVAHPRGCGIAGA